MAASLFLLSIAIAIVVGTKAGMAYGVASFFALFALAVALDSEQHHKE